jgi:hypothetical protein
MANIPKAKNGINSRAFHYQRRDYVRKGYPLLDERYAIDLWYGPKALYGRVDHREEPQMISETNLKNFLSSPELMAADFVVDAFEDLRQYIIKSKRQGKISLVNSFLKSFMPKKAWMSAREEFDENIKEVYRAFVGTFLEATSRHTKIKHFKDFATQFLEFSKISAYTVPVSLTGLVASRFTSPRVSGLVVEIADHPYDMDEIKYKKYMSDPNFLFYQRAARKFGFRIDYNVPWRLVADVSSAEMKQYMLNYEIESTQDLFETYYYDAYRLDLSLLKPHMIQLYNDYVTGNAYIKYVKSGPSRDPGVQETVFKRETVTESELDAEHGNFYWLKFYFYLKTYELQIKWDPAAERKRLQEAKNILDLVDFPSALEYIREQLFKNARG